MKYIAIFSVLITLIFSQIPYEIEINNALKQKKIPVVIYYNSNEHSQQVLNEQEEIKKSILNLNLQPLFIFSNTEENDAPQKYHKFQTLPVIQVIHNYETMTYTGPFINSTFNIDLKKFFKIKKANRILTIQSAKELALAQKDNYYLAYFEGVQQDDKNFQIVKKIESLIGDVTFAIDNMKKNKPSLKVYNYDAQLEYTGKWNLKDIMKFISMYTSYIFLENGSLYDLGILEEKKESSLIYLRETNEELHKKNFEQLFFSWAYQVFRANIIGIDLDHPSIRNNMPKVFKNLMGKTPAIIYYQVKNEFQQRYLFDQKEITFETLKEFKEKIENNRIQPLKISKQVQEKDYSKMVQEIVLDEWEKYITKRRNNVIVYFYKQDCQKCQKRHEIMTHLAENLKKYSDKIQIYFFDLGENDFYENVDIKQVPLLVVFSQKQNPYIFPKIVYEDIMTYLETEAVIGSEWDKKKSDL